MMTITEQMESLKTYRGHAQRPSDFEAFWRERQSRAAPTSVRTEQIPFKNSAAVYETLTISAGERVIHVRSIRPPQQRRFPTILMFHDLNRGVRGWHHMTRFVALGYAVVALENEPAADLLVKPDASGLEQRYLDALTAAQTALILPHTDASRLAVWGEGFGGALSIVTAALLAETARCVVLNPLPADFRGQRQGMPEKALAALDYLDIVHFAPMLTGPFLMGSGLMDKIAPIAAQYAVYNQAVCSKKHLVYPKYEHERINFFENELLKFLHFEV